MPEQIKGTSNGGSVSKADLEQVVPKRMDDIAGIDLTEADLSKANVYIDNDGQDKKMSLQSLMATLVTNLPRYTGEIE